MTTRQMDMVGRRRVPIQHSASFRMPAFNVTLGDIREMVNANDVPDEARLTVRNEPGDQREGTSGATVYTFSWTT